MNRSRFHGSALFAVLGVGVACLPVASGIARLELRGGRVGLLTGGELWLLCVFCAGMLTFLLGLSVMLGGWPGSAAARGRLDTLGEGAEPGPVGRWMMEVGGGLVGLYLIGWIIGMGSL